MTSSERRGQNVYWSVAGESYPASMPLTSRAGLVLADVGASIGDADPELAEYLERLADMLDSDDLDHAGEAANLLREAAEQLVALADTYAPPAELPRLRDLIARMRTCAAKAR